MSWRTNKRGDHYQVGQDSISSSDIHEKASDVIEVGLHMKDYDFEKETKLVPLMEDKINELSIVELVDPEEREKHQGYRFLVDSHGTPTTAFRTEEGLKKWIDQTGIKLDRQENIFGGKNKWWTSKSQYKMVSMAGNKELLDKFGKEKDLRPTEVLSNGDYTRGYIEKGENGNTIYYLNPNYDREELPYHND
jgi:hypothetical protein